VCEGGLNLSAVVRQEVQKLWEQGVKHGVMGGHMQMLHEKDGGGGGATEAGGGEGARGTGLDGERSGSSSFVGA
jgi:hypothetical protein